MTEFKLDRLRGYRNLVVSGHMNPDADSIISTYLMGRVLSEAGIDATLLYPSEGMSEPDKQFISELCEYLSIPLDDFQERVKRHGEAMVCVDFYDNISTYVDVSVVGIIDHHDRMPTPYPAEVCIDKSSATAYLIYKLFDIPWTENDLKMVASAVILDTQYMTNKRKLVQAEVDELNKSGIDMESLRTELLKKFVPFPDFSNIAQHVKTETHYDKYLGDNDTPLNYESMYVEMYEPGCGIDDAPMTEIMDAVDLQFKKHKSVVFFFYDYAQCESLVVAKMTLPQNLGVRVFVEKFDEIVSRGAGFKEFLEKKAEDIAFEVVEKELKEIEMDCSLITDDASWIVTRLFAQLREDGVQCTLLMEPNGTSYLKFPWGFVRHNPCTKRLEIERKKEYDA